MPVQGRPIDNGTIVFRDGLIAAVGANAAVPPGATVIAGKGLSVYPGLIDMGSTTGIEMPPTPRAESPQTTEDVERVKADYLQRAPLKAADYVTPNATALTRAAAAGITSLLATPAGDAFRGQSALINTALPPDEPQIGAVADERRGAMVLRTPVALHVSFSTNPGGGNAYPNSLMGVVAFVRQTFLDAQHYQAAQRFAENTAAPPTRRLASRPAYEPALEALQPALARRMPVAFRGDTAREILRALDMAKAFKLETIVTGAREADQVATDLKVSRGAGHRRPRLSEAADIARPGCRRVALDAAGAGERAEDRGGTGQGRRAVRVCLGRRSRTRATSSRTRRKRSRAACHADDADQGADAAGGDHCRSSRPRGLARSREARQRARHRRRSRSTEKTTVKHVFVEGRAVNLDVDWGNHGGGSRCSTAGAPALGDT